MHYERLVKDVLALDLRRVQLFQATNIGSIPTRKLKADYRLIFHKLCFSGRLHCKRSRNRICRAHESVVNAFYPLEVAVQAVQSMSY